MEVQQIRDPRSTGKVKKLFCNVEYADDGTAKLVSKGKHVNASIDIVDFLRQIPKEYIEKAMM